MSFALNIASFYGLPQKSAITFHLLFVPGGNF